MFCWICGREMDRNDNVQYVAIRNQIMPVCDDDRSCGERGNYGRLNAAEDEALIRAFFEMKEPVPRRLRRSHLYIRVKQEFNNITL